MKVKVFDKSNQSKRKETNWQEKTIEEINGLWKNR